MKNRFRGQLVALAVILLAGIVSAAALFTHTFPGVVPVTSIATAGCPQLVQNGTVFVNTTGSLLFACPDASNKPTVSPFRVLVSNTNATPVFALPTQYSLLSLVPRGSNATAVGGCSKVLGGIILKSGTGPGLPKAGSYDYCVDYKPMPPTGSPTFSVAWYQ